MNSSTISDSHNAPKECGIHIFLGGTLDHTATEAYAVLVFLIIVNIITCPVTIILNTLALLAVNTKPRLKTKSNVALGCLIGHHRWDNGTDWTTSFYCMDNIESIWAELERVLHAAKFIQKLTQSVNCGIPFSAGFD